MKYLQTITGRTIVIISSHKTNRTYTIKTDSGKYKTFPMSKEEFNEAEYWTGNDWNQFLKGDDYARI